MHKYISDRQNKERIVYETFSQNFQQKQFPDPVSLTNMKVQGVENKMKNCSGMKALNQQVHKINGP